MILPTSLSCWPSSTRATDVVSGWRRNRKDKMITRKIPSWIANLDHRPFSGIAPCHDYGCTLKAYRREFLDR